MMKRTLIIALVAVTALVAQPRETWNVGESVYQVATIDLEPNADAQYLNQMKRTWANQMDVFKAEGLVEEYHIYRSINGYDGDFDLLLMVKYKNLAIFDSKRRISIFYTDKNVKERKMIKRMMGVIFPLLMFPTLFGQDYIMFNTIVLELRNGEHFALQQGVKKHNAKYHDGTNGPKAYLWYIHTGPNSGSYNWAIGPTKFSHMDADLSEEHVKDWERNVEKYARSRDHIFMVRDEVMTYNPENEVVGQNILVKRILVKQGGNHHLNAVEEAMNSIAGVLRKTNAKIARRVYRSAFRTEKGDFILVYPFDSWTEFEGDRQGLPAGFAEDFDRINGKGSFEKLGKTISEHTNGITNEVQTMVK